MNIVTKHTQLDHNPVAFVEKSANSPSHMVWPTMLEVVIKPKFSCIFTFMSPWQLQQVQSHRQDILCIDSTRNMTTNFPNLESIVLLMLTVPIQQPNTGGGLPVAWFLTTDKTT